MHTFSGELNATLKAGIRWPHHSCLDTHQSCFSVLPSHRCHCSLLDDGNRSRSPDSTARIASSAIFRQSTNHWLRSCGSMTSFDRLKLRISFRRLLYHVPPFDKKEIIFSKKSAGMSYVYLQTGSCMLCSFCSTKRSDDFKSSITMLRTRHRESPCMNHSTVGYQEQ